MGTLAVVNGYEQKLFSQLCVLMRSVLQHYSYACENQTEAAFAKGVIEIEQKKIGVFLGSTRPACQGRPIIR